MNKPNYCLSYVLLSITFGLLIGISLTYTILKNWFIQNKVTSGPISDEDIRDAVFKNINSERISFLLKKLSDNNNSNDEGMDENTLFVFNHLSELGINTSFANYTVLTSHQNKDKTNSVIKFDKTGHLLHKSQSMNFLSFSPSTEIPLNGSPIYVNYGRLNDFHLLSKMDVSVRGHFVMARYSDIPPGDILKLSQEKGAIGLILFIDSDSEKHANRSLVDNVLVGSGGDPQTPFYPSIESAQRLPVSETLSQIPALFVSYSDAIHILKGLKGPATPESWKINSDNTNIGPDYEDDSYITLEVNSIVKQIPIHNVIGIIEGCIEPDRYVLVGSEGNTIRGKAALLVLSESFANAMKTLKWCPQRSIVFCSWDPLQYSSIGSTEWLEENIKLIENGVIAYLSVDIEIRGNFTFVAHSVPILYQTIKTMADTIRNPNEEEVENLELKTLYDSYKEHLDSKIITGPHIGFNSVNSPFLQRIGIPVLKYLYDCDKSLQTYCEPQTDLINNPFDMSLNFTKTLLEMYVETLRILSDRSIIPLSESLTYYYWVIDDTLDKLKGNTLFYSFNISLDEFDSALNQFFDAKRVFEKVIEEVNEQNDLLVRRINDVLMRFEQTFIDSEGLPYTQHQKHVLYAPQLYNSNEGEVLSGIYRLMSAYTQEENESKKMKIIDDLRKHISVIIFHLNSVSHLLRQSFAQ